MDNPYYEKLINAALRFVSYRPRSEKELTDFLTKKLSKWKVSGVGLITKVVVRMKDLGYVNDENFVSWWIEQRSMHRPKGARVLRNELIAKGISKELLDDIISPKEELQLARKTIDKIKGRLKNFTKLEQKKKIYSYLASRGFASSVIFSVIDEIVGKGYNTGEDLNEDT